LQENSENLFEELIASEGIKNLNKISEKIKNNFEINGWKEYYEEFPLKFEDLPNSKFQENFNFNSFEKKDFNLNELINNNQYEDLLGETFHKKLIFLKPQKNEEIKFKQNSNYNYSNTKSNANSISNNCKNFSFIYIGQVNKFGEKHGKGILYHLDGSAMEEGIWYNDHLMGWIRKILSNGIYFECKKILLKYFILFNFILFNSP